MKLNGKMYEYLYPYTLPFLVLVLYYLYVSCNVTNIFIDKFNELINVSFTLSSISLGFLGTMVGCVTSVTSSVAMETLYSKNADTDLIRYLKEATFTNFLVLILSVILIFVDIPKCEVLYEYKIHYIIYSWIYLFFLSLLCSHRIIVLLFHILYSVNSEAKNKYFQNKRHTTTDFKNPTE